MSATSWPFFTLVLKSAYSALILPDTWLPTWTVTTAFEVPVADMVASISPRSTREVLYSCRPASLSRAHPPSPATAAAPAAIMTSLRFNMSCTHLLGARAGRLVASQVIQKGGITNHYNGLTNLNE